MKIWPFNFEECLYISPNALVGYTKLEDFLFEMSRPVWAQDKSGRVDIDKDPDKTHSPDIYDGSVLGYQMDSYAGLTED